MNLHRLVVITAVLFSLAAGCKKNAFKRAIVKN